MIADTSFLIDVLNAEPRAVGQLRELAAREEPLWIPATALQELYVGTRLCERPEQERARVENLERSLPVLAFDAASARIAGTLEGDLARRGKRPPVADAQIAATALRRGEAVLTRDKRFPKIEGLVVERY